MPNHTQEQREFEAYALEFLVPQNDGAEFEWYEGNPYVTSWSTSQEALDEEWHQWQATAAATRRAVVEQCADSIRGLAFSSDAKHSVILSEAAGRMYHLANPEEVKT